MSKAPRTNWLFTKSSFLPHLFIKDIHRKDPRIAAKLIITGNNLYIKGKRTPTKAPEYETIGPDAPPCCVIAIWMEVTFARKLVWTAILFAG